MNSTEEVKKIYPGEENMPAFHFFSSVLFYFLRFFKFLRIKLGKSHRAMSRPPVSSVDG